MIKQSLLDSWNFFKNHANALFLIVLPIVIPLQIVLALMFSDPPTSSEGADAISPEQFAHAFKRIFIEFLFAPIYRIAVIFYLGSVIDGNILSRVDCWKLSLKHWVSYLIMVMVMSFLLSITLVSSGVFGPIGLILLGLPVVGFLIARFAFAEFDLLFNNNTPFRAIKTSFSATAPHFGVILRGYLAIFAMLCIPYLVLIQLLPYGAASLVSILFSVTLYLALTIYAYRIYEIAKPQSDSTE